MAINTALIIPLYETLGGFSGTTVAELIAQAGGALPIEDEGVPVVAVPTALNFIGAGVTAVDNAGVADITIPGGAAAVPIEDEGVPVVAVPTALNFIGAGVTAADNAGVADITIPGGGATSLIAVKATDTSRISNAVIDDPDLLFTLTTGRWILDMGLLSFNTTALPGILYALSRNNGLVIDTIQLVTSALENDVTPVETYNKMIIPTGNFRTTMLASQTTYMIVSAVFNVTTAGELALKWGQLTTSAAATVLQKNSFMRAVRSGS